VSDGQTLWAERFDENFTDIFAVEDRVSEKVVRLLAVALTGQEQMLLTKRYTDNTQAYEFYLKGNYYSGTEQRLKESIELYQRAINLDPGYALAYARLADSYMRLGGFPAFLPPRENFPKAEAAVKKALELDETLGEAHLALAYYKLNYEWDWSGAEQEFKRALKLDPNGAGHVDYGTYLQRVGRLDEAIAERKRARELDPLSPMMIANVGYPYYYARQYPEAIKHYQSALELNPQFSWSHLWIGQAYIQMGRHEEAVAEINKALTSGDVGVVRALTYLGYAFAVAGKRDEAQKVLDGLAQLSKRKYVSPHSIAVIYAGLGEKDQMFHWLEQAYQERNPFMSQLKMDPVFDSVRSDRRFADLMRRVGLRS
jgi:tetratricopeptide (TPR) repeat protein